MNDKLFELNDGWVINSIFDSIENCEIIKPTYNKEWLSSNKIMLDKRKWLIEELSIEWILFTDILKIDWQYFYYWIDKINNLAWVYNENWLKVYELPYEEWNPLRVARGIGWGWQIVIDATETTNNLQATEDQGTVTLNVSWASSWQYITFTTWVLRWLTVQISLSEWWKIYILSTDIIWRLPANNDKYYVFTELRDTIVIWSTNTLHIVHTTDRDDNFEFKYIIQLEDSWLKHYSISIDWIDVYFDTNDINIIKPYLEWELWASYQLEIIKWFLYLNKVDWTEIIFSDFKNGYIFDFQPVSLWTKNTRSYGWFRLNIEWHIISSNDIHWPQTSYTNYPFHIFGNYTKIERQTSYWNEEVRYYKNDIILNVKNFLPSGYQSKTFDIKSIPQTFVHQSTVWQVMETFNYNRRIFIYKNDWTQFTASVEPYYWYLIYFGWLDWTTRNFEFDWITDSWSVWSWWAAWSFISYIIWDKLRLSWKYRVVRWNWTWWGVWYIWLQIPWWLQAPTFSVTTNNNSINITENITDIPNQRYTICDPYTDKITPSNINDTNAYWYPIVDNLVSNIKDVVNYDWVIFAMTDTHFYFSRSYQYSNTHFYEKDFFLYKNWFKLVPFGKTLLALWEDNKLITWFEWDFYTLQWVRNYRINDLEYNWNIYSRYSYLFDEWNLYILEDSKRLVLLRLNQIDQFSYAIVTEEVNSNLRWLFDKIEWECFVNRKWLAFNFLAVNEWKTVNFKFDISLLTWIINKYDYEIYHLWEKVWTNWRIAVEWWYTDFGTDYTQVINMSTWNLINFTQLFMIRTIFWLNNEFPLDVTREIEYELWEWVLEKQVDKLNNYNFDTDRELTLDEWDLTDEVKNKYQWSIASIQHSIQFAWKYIRIKYYSDKRFIIWDTYLLERFSKAYINNILNSN